MQQITGNLGLNFTTNLFSGFVQDDWQLAPTIKLLYGVRYTDMCAFRAISREMLARLDMREMTYGWNIEMQMKAARSGLRILELPVPYRCRAGGKSKVAGTLAGSLRAGWRITATIVRIALSAR